MLSVLRGISSSYSCGTPCPPRYDRAYTDPDTTEVSVEDWASHSVLEIDVDSYNNEYGPYSATVVAASTYDTNIATFDGSSVYGVSMGDTTTTATVEYPLYWWEVPTEDCIQDGTNQDDVYGSVQVNGKFSLGTVSFTSPDPLVIRNGETAVLTVVINIASVNPASPVRLTISATNPTAGGSSLEYDSGRNLTLVCSSTSCSHTETINFRASTNPPQSVTWTAQVALARLAGTPENVTVDSTAKNSSNSFTVQHTQ